MIIQPEISFFSIKIGKKNKQKAIKQTVKLQHLDHINFKKNKSAANVLTKI